MTPLEIKRMKLELVQVGAARASLEFRIEEHLEDIDRIKKSIAIQVDKELELQGKIEEAVAALAAV